MKNKILIAIFIISMLGPSFAWMCVSGYIATENNENRTLAEKPELTLATFSEYPQAYENYYNDHLPFKSQVVNLKTRFDYKILGTIDSEKVLLGKDNWLFFKGTGEPQTADEQPIADYQGTNIYTEEELAEIADNITAVDAHLQEKNIEFSVLISPNKEHIYSEYLPDNLLKVNEESKADLMVSYLHDKVEVPVLYPLDELMEYKNDYRLYYKYDSHWNNLGAFIGAQHIRELYQGESDTLDEFKVSIYQDEALKDLANMLNMPEEFIGDPIYFVEDYKTEVTASLVEASADTYCHVYTSDAQDARTVLVIRDSYGEQMMASVAKDFQNVVFVHRNAFNPSYIEQYQPDIVVYQIVERATNDLKDLKALMGI